MSLFVDTSVWSLALRRDTPPQAAHVQTLMRAIEAGETLLTTGLVLQELLQGFSGPRAREQILNQFSAVPLLVPDREDHVSAAELRNTCRRSGIQIGTIDALLAQLCIRHDLTMLTADSDFKRFAKHSALKLWNEAG
ncbi:MAG TPA: PIN domain-containing protein [Xanthobacteraceae bacterium]|nr:PIN domain-containing protein [Xanthobacteraceae bacterium]